MSYSNVKFLVIKLWPCNKLYFFILQMVSEVTKDDLSAIAL